MRWISLICLCAIVSSGCATLDDYHYLVVHHHRSDQAWKQYRPGLGHRGTSSDYASGWKQGYFEVSTGGTGEPPAVPPRKYWSPKYQDLAGQRAIEDWYAGFQDGATVAESEGNGAWHAIYSGPTVPVDPPFWEFPEFVPAEPPSATAADQLPHPAPPIVPEERESVTAIAPPPVIAVPVSDQVEPEPQEPQAQQVPPQVVKEVDEPVRSDGRETTPSTSRRSNPMPSEPASKKPLVTERKPALEPAPVVVSAQPISTRMAAITRRVECGKTPSEESASQKLTAEATQESSRRVHQEERESIVIPEVVTEE
jgi:hypothetical protein